MSPAIGAAIVVGLGLTLILAILFMGLYEWHLRRPPTQQALVDALEDADISLYRRVRCV